MTDATLLQNPELLLKWSASLDYQRLSFDDFVLRRESDHQTERGSDDLGSSCADAAGHSVRVPSRVAQPSR